MPGKAKTSAAFDASYKKKSHLQNRFNRLAVRYFAERIQEKITDKTRTLQILDLCCGHGDPTAALLERLEIRGFSDVGITGCDLSAEQIKIAQEKYTGNPRLSFEVRDVAAIGSGDDVECYDIVVSFFGFHWIPDKQALARGVEACLKPGGLVLFVTPIDKPDQVAMRQKGLAAYQTEVAALTDVAEPYLFEHRPEVYESAFRQAHFVLLNTIRFRHQFSWPTQQFLTFLSSWMPEVRAMKELGVDPASYLKKLIEALPEAERLQPPLTACRLLNGNVAYEERLLALVGQKPAAVARL